MAKETQAGRQATLKYRKEKCKQLNVMLYPADADIAEWLDTVGEKAKYVKRLIREDMEKGGR